MINAADFITVYGKEFNIYNENLHGDNVYKFSEFALRRDLIKKAIKQLVLDDLIEVTSSNRGFYFKINSKGLNYCNLLNSDYANSYRQISIQAHNFINNKTEGQILNAINKRSIVSIGEDHINE